MSDIIRSKSTVLAVAIFSTLTLWWLLIRFVLPADSFQDQLFAASYGVMALYGALCGFYFARKYGFTRSLMGKAIIGFSLGLLAQEFGQLAYSYYIYFKGIEVPYPSIGDIGYFGSIPFYIYGVVHLAEASGINFSLKKISNQLQAIVVPLLLLLTSYFIFLQDYTFDVTQPLTISLDFGYPLGQVVYVSIALMTYMLSYRILGGIMRTRIFVVLFALCVQYMADYTFLVQAMQEVWKVGEINDYMYLLSYFVMSIALINLRISVVRSKLSQQT